MGHKEPLKRGEIAAPSLPRLARKDSAHARPRTRSTARRVKTTAMSRLYPEEPRKSSRGSTWAATASAARRTASGLMRWPLRACSTAVACTGVGPAAPRATLRRRQGPSSVSAKAATDTVAESSAGGGRNWRETEGGADGGLVVVGEELGDGDDALAAAGDELDAGVEDDEAGRRVLGRVGVGEAAADSGDVADAHSGDVAVDLGEEGPALLDDGRGLDVAVVGEGADVQAVRLGADAGEAGDAGEADEVLRLDEGLLHEDDEGGAAGHRPGVLAVLLEEGEDLLQAGRGVEVEVAH